MKAALSHALERTLMLAWARPAHYTQVCLRSSHTRTPARRVWNWFGSSATHHVPHQCCVKRKEPSPITKNMPLHASSPSTTAPPDHSTTHMFSTCPTMNLRSLQHPCHRPPAISTRVPASFASLAFAHSPSYAPPSQQNPPTLHSANKRRKPF